VNYTDNYCISWPLAYFRPWLSDWHRV